MKEQLAFQLYGKTVKFTPDGRIFIMDAIEAVTNSERIKTIWEGLHEKHPEVAGCYDLYPLSEHESVPVAGSDGWDKIMFLLHDYLVSLHYPDG